MLDLLKSVELPLAGKRANHPLYAIPFIAIAGVQGLLLFYLATRFQEGMNPYIFAGTAVLISSVMLGYYAYSLILAGGEGISRGKFYFSKTAIRGIICQVYVNENKLLGINPALSAGVKINSSGRDENGEFIVLDGFLFTKIKAYVNVKDFEKAVAEAEKRFAWMPSV